LSPIIVGHAAMRVADTRGAGPALYAMVSDRVSNTSGLVLLAHILPSPVTPQTLEIQTLGGKNNRCLPSNLDQIWGNCFGAQVYCAPVYTADPSDYRHLYAVDFGQQSVMSSMDAGETWQKDSGLTDLVTNSAGSMTDSAGNAQV